MIRRYEKIKNSTLTSKIEVLYDNLKTESIEYILLHVLLIIRRIVYGVNIILFYASPFIQVVINSSLSFACFHYISLLKPFKTQIDNIMSIYIEFITFLILSIIAAFIKEDLSSDLHKIADWCLVILIYSSIMVPALFNLVISIKDLIIYFKTTSGQNMREPSVTETNQ